MGCHIYVCVPSLFNYQANHDHPALPAARLANAPRDEGQSKHQAVLALDMAQWKEAIELFDIKEPMIRHREEESYNSVGKKGWYA